MKQTTPQTAKPAARSTDFTTVSFLDLGGALSSAQRRRLVAPILRLWSRIARARGK